MCSRLGLSVPYVQCSFWGKYIAVLPFYNPLVALLILAQGHNLRFFESGRFQADRVNEWSRDRWALDRLLAVNLQAHPFYPYLFTAPTTNALCIAICTHYINSIPHDTQSFRCCLCHCVSHGFHTHVNNDRNTDRHYGSDTDTYETRDNMGCTTPLESQLLCPRQTISFPQQLSREGCTKAKVPPSSHESRRCQAAILRLEGPRLLLHDRPLL